MSLSLVACFLTLASPATLNGQTLTNGRWTILRLNSETARITGPDGASADFRMVFRIFLATEDPSPAKTQIAGVNYNGGISWIASVPDPNSGIGGSNPDWGDGFDPGIVTNPGSRTANLFNAASSKEIRPVGDTLVNSELHYQFANDPSFDFSARLGIDSATGVPMVTTTLVSKGTAWYSMVYTGAPSCTFQETEQIWQPLVWQGRRFPSLSYLTPAYHCPVPSTLVTRAGKTVGVVAHPREFPFMPLPVFENSRFGVAVRNSGGNAQPMVAAPVLGGTGSRLTSGQTHVFRMCPFVTTGDTTFAFERIAREIYDFRDVRHNQIGSLNRAFENMLAYGMSSYSHFIEEEKGCSYATDAPGTIKNVSSLNPVDMALSTDNDSIWHERAYPYIEYMLSRAKFLFTTDESQNIQSPAYTLEGPVAPVSELVSLNRISNGAAAEMIELAETEYAANRARNLDDAEPGASWQNALHLYRATGGAAYLQAAIAGADAYIARRITNLPTNFNDPDAPLLFWSGYAPRFIDLLLLYDATGEQRFLDASWKGARFYAMHCWIAPAIPQGTVTVNKGNVAPVYSYLAERTVGPISIPEETVPAWRVSAQGLHCESSATSTGHRAIFNAHFAPWFLRLARLKNDDFLRDIARSAVVGRWMNFPGYHMNTGRTTVYEKPDYPLRPFNQLSYNSFHFNHVWPMMSVVLDYLVTDAENRSNGAITFEREYAEGYAYLQSSIYGMRPGVFHGTPVKLWMPSGLADVSTNELNYIAARGTDSLCLAFTNQGFGQETATVHLDTTLVPALSGRTRSAQVWINNQPASPISVNNGSFSITVPAKGIASIVINSTTVAPKFQDKFANLSASDAWLDGHLEWTSPAARALLLNFGSGYRSFYFYLKNSKRDFTSLRLRYEIDGRYGEAADDAFPWEFTVPLGSGDESVFFELEATRTDGTVNVFGPSTLVKDSTGGLRLGDSTAGRSVIAGSSTAQLPGVRLLDSASASVPRRVTIASPSGTFLNGSGSTPSLAAGAQAWLLTGTATGGVTLQHASSGNYIKLGATGGIPPKIEIPAFADQRIESTSPSSPISANWKLRVGPLGAGEAVRSLLRFDFSGLPSEPDSVQLKLTRGANYSGNPANLDQVLTLNRLTRSFQNGEASWLYARNGTLWTTPGGDINPTPLASVAYNPATTSEGQALVFPSQPSFLSAVNSAIAVGGQLDLLISSDLEAAADRSDAYFAASENPNEGPPRLILDYHSSFAANALVKLDPVEMDHFVIEPAPDGGSHLRHAESGLYLVAGDTDIVVSTGPDAPWNISEFPSTQIVLGTSGDVLSSTDDVVGTLPSGSFGDTTGWYVVDQPDGSLRIVHAQSGQILTHVRETATWREIPVQEDIRIRSDDARQQITWENRVGSIATSDNYRCLLRFDLLSLPRGFSATDAKLIIDGKSNDSASQSLSHTLQLYRVTQPYSFAGVTWNTADPGLWTKPGGTYNTTLLASAVANPTTVSVGQDIVFSGGATLASVIEDELAGDGVLDLLIRSNRENNGRSFFILSSKEDAGSPGLDVPRIRVAGGIDRLMLRPLSGTERQSFEWWEVDGRMLLVEATSGKFLTNNSGTLQFTSDATAAITVDFVEAPSTLSLAGTPLGGNTLWTWFGAMDFTHHPWCYHAEMGWIYLGWEARDALWAWIEGIGWIYTSEQTYPLCFSEQLGEWLLFETTPGENQVSFAGLNSGTRLRIPAGSGFDVVDWLNNATMAVPTSPPQPPAGIAPAFEPVFSKSNSLVRGSAPGSWSLVTHGRLGKDLILEDSTDLTNWWMLDRIQTVDEKPIIFELTTGEDKMFWRTDWQDW